MAHGQRSAGGARAIGVRVKAPGGRYTGDADELLRSVCEGPQIEKIHYCVPFAGLTWEVDVYEGDRAGVVLAEVELEREDQPFSKPDWAGLEVSGDPRFKKTALLRLRARAGRPSTAAEILATPH